MRYPSDSTWFLLSGRMSEPRNTCFPRRGAADGTDSVRVRLIFLFTETGVTFLQENSFQSILPLRLLWKKGRKQDKEVCLWEGRPSGKQIFISLLTKQERNKVDKRKNWSGRRERRDLWTGIVN